MRLERSLVGLVGAMALTLTGCEALGIDLLPPDDQGSSGRTSAEGGSPGQVDPSGGSATPPVGGGGKAAEPTGSPIGGAGGEAPSLPQKVLFVVDENPRPGDDDIEQRVEDTGRAVSRISELVVLADDAEGFDLVVISPSADRVDLGTTLRDAAVPLLILETTVAENHGLGKSRQSTGDREVVIEAEEHPLALGRTGTVTLCAAGPIHGNEVVAGGISIAVASAQANNSPIIAYPAGAQVGDDTLPASRVALGALKAGGCQTELGWEFFDAAVEWLSPLP